MRKDEILLHIKTKYDIRDVFYAEELVRLMNEAEIRWDRISDVEPIRDGYSDEQLYKYWQKVHITGREEESPVYYASFSDEEILDIISQRLCVLPTSVFKKGDLIQNTGNTFSCTAWQYDTDTYATLDINEPLQVLEQLFCPLCDKIVEIKSQYDVDICLDIIIVIEDNVSPAMCLKQSTIEFAAKVGARIDFDVYVI